MSADTSRPDPADDAAADDPYDDRMLPEERARTRARAHAEQRALARDLLHGMIAGIAGTWALDRIDWFLYDREPASSRLRTRWVRPGGEDPGHALATRIERIAGMRLTRDQHEIAGQVVHYLGGVTPAALYGALRPRVPGLGAGRGLAYGLLAFTADLIGSPAAGLAARPGAYPWQVHARSLAAHVIYGLVTDALVRALAVRADSGR